MGGARRRWLLDGLGALLCAAVLVTSFVVAAVSDTSRPTAVAGELDLDGVLAPGEASAPGVRSLPLLDPTGPVVTGLPGGAGLDDPATVRGTIDLLAERLGMLTIMDELLSTELAEEEDYYDNDLFEGYPYAYAQIDPIVDAWLTPEAVQSDPTALLDLTGLLLLDSARSQRVERYDRPPNSWAGVAYSMLRRARDLAPSCDVQLQLTYAMAMGFAPDITDVERETERAETACPGDPTALWLLGRVQSVQASLIEVFFTFERGPRAMAMSAEATFAELRRAYPDSPLGWAGQGDLLLQLADESEGLGAAPFQVRAWRREALAAYAEARRLSDDPALLAGWGHALSVNGRHDEAVEALEQLQELLPGEPAYQVLLLDALRRAGRPADVVAAVESEPVPDVPLTASLSLLPQTRGTVEPASAAFGAGGSRSGFVFDQSQRYDAGSSARDLGFVPVSNGIWTEPWCRAGDYIAVLIRTGRADTAWGLVAGGLDPRSWDGVTDCKGSPLDRYVDEFTEPGTLAGLRDAGPTAVGSLGLVAAAETGDPADLEAAFALLVDEYTPERELLSQAQDARSDFWRAAGDMDRAADVVEEWREQLPEDPWAAHRAGELAFLDGDYDAAAKDYEQAEALWQAALASETDWGDHALGEAYVEPDQAAVGNLLELGAARELGGEPDQARAIYQDALGRTEGFETWDYGSEVLFRLRSQLGFVALAVDDYETAVDWLTEVLEEEYAEEGPPGPDDEVALGRRAAHSLGAQDNNLALALAELDRDDDALLYARSALAHDPANPVFLDTVAFVQHLAGDGPAAADAYRLALEADPTSYVSANNLAVLLAEDGDRDEAAELLEDALKAAPDYAIGWHNLGVVRADRSEDLLASQGALTVAGELDRDLRGRTGLIVDDEVYDSGVDVSKPVPPDWTYAASATEYRDRFTLTLLLLMLLRALWTFGLDKVIGKVSKRVITGRGRRWSVWAAAGVGVLVIGIPLYRTGQSPLERGVLAGAGVALVLLPVFVRGLALRRTTLDVGQYSWGPSLLVGAVGAPLGLAFAPPPVLDPRGPHLETHPSVRRLRRLVPLVVLPVALAFLVLAAVHPAPLARTLALSSVTLLGCVLTPIPPLDQSHVKSRLVGLAITLGLAGAAALFAVKWI